MSIMTEARPMARKGKAVKTTPVRLTDEAISWARIASGYTGESMSDYASRVIVERGKQDADRLHDEATGEAKPKTKAKGKGVPE